MISRLRSIKRAMLFQNLKLNNFCINLNGLQSYFKKSLTVRLWAVIFKYLLEFQIESKLKCNIIFNIWKVVGAVPVACTQAKTKDQFV